MVVARFLGMRSRMPNAISEVAATETNKHGSVVAPGSYAVRFGTGWLSTEAIGVAGDPAQTRSGQCICTQPTRN